MKRKKVLSVRERRLIKNILSGMPTTKALIQAGYSDQTARKAQKAILGKFRIYTAIQKGYEKAGISDKKLIDILKEGLESTKIIATMAKGFIEVPDFATRHKYLELAHKLRGDFPSEKKDVSVQGDMKTKIVFEVINDDR